MQGLNTIINNLIIGQYALNIIHDRRLVIINDSSDGKIHPLSNDVSKEKLKPF